MGFEENFFFVISGGAGTRLWPASRTQFPKQFIDLFPETGNSLFGHTVERLRSLGHLGVVTTKALRAPTEAYLKGRGIEADCVYEPMIRNTCAAAFLATWVAYKKNPKALVGIFPSDHLIENAEMFQKCLKVACEAAHREQNVVTLGIAPSYPATGYGYIKIQNHKPKEVEALAVEKFIEKPNLELAKKLLAEGGVVWNSGMFLFPAHFMVECFKKLQPKFYESFLKLNSDFSNIDEVYKDLPNLSFDVGIMEKLNAISCVPMDAGWSDVGSWEEVARLKAEVTSENILSLDGDGNFYNQISGGLKKTVFLGVKDLLVVETPDALLITTKGKGQDLKKVVEELKKQNTEKILDSHAFEDRPWGNFEVLRDTKSFKSKIIRVRSGGVLSYQSHKKRAEHWVIIEGEARVTLNDVEKNLGAGDHIFIPQGAKHRIANPGKKELVFIEVQTGSYFGEDDITRYQDLYGRS